MRTATKKTPLPRLVTLIDQSREINVPYTTMRDCAARGEFPIVRIGRSSYVDPNDIQEFIERSKVKAGR